MSFCFRAIGLIAFLVGAPPAWASTLDPPVPAPIVPSEITLKVGPQLTFVADLPRRPNIASPVAIGEELYVVNQLTGIGRWTGTTLVPLLDASSVPEGVTPSGREAFHNMAGLGNTAYIAFTSETLPNGTEPVGLPADPNFDNDRLHTLIYRYDLHPTDGLSNPTLVLALERPASGHSGGAMLALPDDKVLFLTGDALNQDYNGKGSPQDPDVTPGKVLVIEGQAGTFEVAAIGVRNSQQISLVGENRDEVAFVDIGWTIAEEVNRISVEDLLDTETVENFGWGVNPDDGLAREGTFYVSEGPEADAEVEDVAPVPEDKFEQPYAQFGRPDGVRLFAGSGPISMAHNSDVIDLLFGDLASGQLYATKQGSPAGLAPVFSVSLVNGTHQPIEVSDLLNGTRADLRLFEFPDGRAGMLFERDGTAFALTDVTSLSPVPLPASALFLIFALATARCVTRRLT